MTKSVLKMVTLLAALAGLWAHALAQEPPKDAKGPNDDKFKEYELTLEQIHSRAGRNVWNPHQAKFWSEKQCRSCHAAPGGTAGRVNELFLTTGTVANGLGIEVAPLDGTLRAHLNIDEKSGLVITSAPEQSEGAKAGLKHHDVLLTVNEQGVNEPAKFNELLSGLQGKKARFGLLRQGKPLALEAAVPQTPWAVLDRSVTMDYFWADDRYRLGVTLSEADDTLRSHLKLAGGEGLVVTEVVDDSPAAKMGVKLHDVLVELDGKRLTSVDAINGQIQEIKEKTVLLKLLRSGQEVTCQIAPKKGSEPVRALTELILVDDLAHTHHPALVRWFDTKSGKAVEGGEVLLPLGPASDAAAQLAELKKQLAELGKTVEKLEAVISPPASPAEEKRPENPEKK